ncbi:MAG TPA: helix-turn-helix transcriptional regulator [Gaiellaceae bacterium]|nr:helix-turn-helix transcriptional regulator [Gaiellaceae bacterium]
MIEPSSKPFGLALEELLLDDGDVYVSRSGNVKWARFAAVLDGVSRTTLRNAVLGARAPSRAMMEECARALSVSPRYFAEFRRDELADAA